MATLESTSSRARRALANNEYARWCSPQGAASGLDCRFAAQRLQGDVFSPQLNPKFSIDGGGEIFMMGSCFARGLEQAALCKKMNVTSLATDIFNSFHTSRKGLTPAGVTNKYNSFAILNELTWALDQSQVYPEQALIEVEHDQWIDPHTNPALQYLDRQCTIENREKLFSVVRRIKSADLVFLSLTLNEVWYDTQTGHYLNITPLPKMFESCPDRYTFHVLRYPQILESLEGIFSVLQIFGKTGQKIVATVCPVPMVATFTGQDVVLANTYCKSVLRTALHDWAESHENVDYFPCYEVAVHSEPQSFFIEDRRHVQSSLAHYFIQLLMDNYMVGSPPRK
ncbi:MAG: GSCFA domain-containing protein [Pseudomonadota bacterium]